MNKTKDKRVIERVGPRSPIEAGITCRPYASSGATRASDGVMRNFSNGGFYIETSHYHKPGTILIMHMIRYPPMLSTMADKERPRSICLAEVKWRQELADDNATGYGIGLRYLY
jgi:hypothetical protein